MADKVEYVPVLVTEIEFSKGVSPVDLYIFMQATQKYIQFVAPGEAMSPEKLANLNSLSGKNLYARKGTVRTAADKKSPTEEVRDILAKVSSGSFQGDVLSAQAGSALKSVFQMIADPSVAEPAKVSAMITQMADSILATVAPDAGDLRLAILKNLKNIHVMNHSAAISALAVLCAVANDMKSKSVLQSMTHAVLLMDAGLADIENHHLETYYRNRAELPEHIKEKIQNHPVRSQQMASGLSIATDGVVQIILTHHELNNGQGYHRNLKGQSFSGLTRVITFAVDLYESIKGAELRKTPLSLRDALMGMDESGIEPQLRRHHNKTVENVLLFLGLKAPPS